MPPLAAVRSARHVAALGFAGDDCRVVPAPAAWCRAGMRPEAGPRGKSAECSDHGQSGEWTGVVIARTLLADAAPRQQAPRSAAIQTAAASGAHARETGIVLLAVLSFLQTVGDARSVLTHTRFASLSRAGGEATTTPPGRGTRRESATTQEKCHVWGDGGRSRKPLSGRKKTREAGPRGSRAAHPSGNAGGSDMDDYVMVEQV